MIDVFQQSEAMSPRILEGISIYINLFKVDIHLKFLATLTQFEPMFDSPPDRPFLCLPPPLEALREYLITHRSHFRSLEKAQVTPNPASQHHTAQFQEATDPRPSVPSRRTDQVHDYFSFSFRFSFFLLLTTTLQVPHEIESAPSILLGPGACLYQVHRPTVCSASLCFLPDSSGSSFATVTLTHDLETSQALADTTDSDRLQAAVSFTASSTVAMSTNGDAFDTKDMSAALESTSDTPSRSQPVGAPADKAEAASKARAYGFVAPMKYDYSVYGVKTAEGAEDEAVPRPAYNWAASAVKYEFTDELGDVAPRVPELEALLFRNEHIMRMGRNMKNLQFRVTVEGPAEIRPVSSVSLLHPFMFAMMMC